MKSSGTWFTSGAYLHFVTCMCVTCIKSQICVTCILSHVCVLAALCHSKVYISLSDVCHRNIGMLLSHVCHRYVCCHYQMYTRTSNKSPPNHRDASLCSRYLWPSVIFHLQGKVRCWSVVTSKFLQRFNQLTSHQPIIPL